MIQTKGMSSLSLSLLSLSLFPFLPPSFSPSLPFSTRVYAALGPRSLSLIACPPRYETISDLMILQDQIDSFQKLVFSYLRHGLNNECRISSLVPLVQESYGIYKFITSMLRAMHISTDIENF